MRTAHVYVLFWAAAKIKSNCAIPIASVVAADDGSISAIQLASYASRNQHDYII